MGASSTMVNDTCMMLKHDVHLGVRGVYNYAKDLWGCHVIHIDTLVLLNALVYLFLGIFGSQRRRSRNWFIQKGTLVANTLSILLGTYTLGSMQSSKVKSSMYPIWAATLFILHVCTNAAYSLDDNKHVTRVLYRLVLYNAYGILLVANAINGDSPAYACFLYAVGHYKFKYIQAPCVLASRSWNLNKMIADYMYNEHTKGEFVPATMKGCHYLVDWPLDNSKLGAPSYASRFVSDDNEIIDIEKIWLCNDISLNQDLKDTCLSFSLFLLLRRRYFGFSCTESKERAHDFVFKGLLRENEEGTIDYNQAFRLIEIELAFMYDFFFTTFAAIYYGSRAATAASLLSAFFLCLTILWAVLLHPPPIQEGDMTISLFLLASAALLELLQLLLYWTSIWSRVSFVCQYLREQARLNTRGSCCSCSSFWCCHCMLLRLKELLAKIGVHWTPNKYYWQHRLGQYSLLDYRPTFHDKFKDCLGRVTDENWDPSHVLPILQPIDRHTWRVRRKRGKSAEVTAQVQKGLIYSLKQSNGKLTNGKSSLVSNGAGHLLWACERVVLSESDTSCIILTWHIATWYCERGILRCGPCPDEGTELKIHVGIATKLSKYCAYLMVSAPKLLPGHEYDTSRVFDEVAGEARKFLPYVVKDKYQALKNYGLEESEDTIFQSGAKLGKQLEEIEDVTRRWKVLADFWSEMLLYIAPSDNVEEHIEQLTRGGEFITHLWALLSHAGILQRDQHNLSHIRAENTEGNSAGHQESEQNSANYEENTQDNSARARHQVEQQSADREEATPPVNHPVRMPDNLLSTGLALKAPSQGVQARPSQIPVSEIATENECLIDVAEASSCTQQALPQQV